MSVCVTVCVCVCVPHPSTQGYFHSTMLMQALRMGFFRVRQSRALGGLVAAVVVCFLGLV